MDDSYIAKLVCCGEGAAVSFSPNTSFVDFCTSVRDRFPSFSRGILKLRYTVFPDTTVYHLENDVDMKMMFGVMDRFSSHFLDVDVCFLDVACGSESVLSNSVGDDSVTVLDENHYLGCYRQEESQNFLTKGWGLYIASEGQIFQGGVIEFREKLRMYCIHKGFNIVFARNKKERVVAECAKKKDGCPWRVKASLCVSNGFSIITELVNEHTCFGVIRKRKHKMMGSKVVKSIIQDKIRENPNKRAVDLVDEIQKSYGLEVKYHTAWYGKELAKLAVLGDEGLSYTHLEWFCKATYAANPDSKICLEYFSEGNRFQRMFVCYGASMKGFMHCRPILFIDATFITNKYQGMLISASAKDGNNGLYPIGYAIVDSEDASNWRFFLTCLSEELSKYSMRQITFISDRNAGLMSVYPDIFPNNPHGFCYRHLRKNLEDKYNGYLKGRISFLFMSCAYSRTREMYDVNRALLEKEGGNVVKKFLNDLGPVSSWCMAFFNGDRSGEMTNNLAECYNSWIKELKSHPIIELNEALRKKSMSLIANRKEEAKGWTTFLCPNIEKKLQENLVMGLGWGASRSDTSCYEVHCPKFNTMVDLDNFFCSCGLWQINGIPCAHSLVVIQQLDRSPYSYVNPSYTVEAYQKTYSFTINPVSTISRSIGVSESSVLIQPPVTKRPPGRPRMNRFKGKSEGEGIRRIKCGRCGKYGGHNRATCTAPI